MLRTDNIEDLSAVRSHHRSLSTFFFIGLLFLKLFLFLLFYGSSRESRAEQSTRPVDILKPPLLYTNVGRSHWIIAALCVSRVTCRLFTLKTRNKRGRNTTHNKAGCQSMESKALKKRVGTS